MGQTARTITGARAKIFIDGKLIGIVQSVNCSVNYGVQDIAICGNEATAEIVYTHMAPVSLDMSGFRVYNNGPYKDLNIPQLQDLLNHQDFSVSVMDRQNPNSAPIINVIGVRPVSWTSSFSSRGIMDLSGTFMGLTFQDESGPQSDLGSVIYG